MSMSRYRLIIIWLLLLIPTLLLGLGALYLLKGEEERLLYRTRSTANDRIMAIAGNLDLAIAEVKDGLMLTLKGMPGGAFKDLADLLEEWKRGNPLVRNVFIWEQGRGLQFPDPETPSSDEETGFIRRYSSLFANQGDWRAPERDVPTSVVEERVSSVFEERKGLRELAQQSPVAADMAAAPAALSEPLDGFPGWRSWFTDNRLHLIGWYAWNRGANRVGLEVEMMALLSRLLGNFPFDPPHGETYALVDGNGDIFHQVGPLEITPGLTPLAEVAISELPHWQVAAYVNPEGGGANNGFLLVASLLVGTFVVAILLGGSLLLWQAHRNQWDARQKTSFVSNVSHELKTPLTTIRMYAEMLGEQGIKDSEKQQIYLNTIVRESQRLTRLVNNVLDFSRLEQGRKEFSIEQLDLVLLLHQLLDSQLVRIEEAGMQLVRDIRTDSCSMACDRDALEQILINLIDNAIKYAAAGKVLTVELKKAKDRCIVRVKDKGPGIPAAHREQVFNKFHRVDDSLTARRQGSGLGLSIARQLAEGLGGTLDYCNNDAGGGCFELTLIKEVTS